MNRLFKPSLLLILFFTACKKEQQNSGQSNAAKSFSDSALVYLRANLPANEFATLDLNKYQALKFHNQQFGLQIFMKSSINNFLLLTSSRGIYNCNWVDMSELKSIHRGYKSGSVLLRTIDKRLTTEFIVDSNKVIKVKSDDDSGNKTETDLSPVKNNSEARIHNTNVSIPYEVMPEIVIYMADTDDDPYYTSLYWLTNQAYDYMDLYYPTMSGMNPIPIGSGGGGYGTTTAGTNNVIAAPSFFPPEQPIVDLVKELKCFTVNNISTYTVSVNVNQPYPNSRDIFKPGGDFMVGHTFLTLEQDNADGTSIIRSIGFYPKNGVKPTNTYDKSVFGDDSNTPFDVSLKMSVTGAELSKLITTILYQQEQGYDLNNFNCTSAPMASLASIQINLPSTKADEVLFSGNDPADLGEDIRNLDLTKFSAANGNRKVIRTVSSSNNLTPLPREGNC